MAEFRKTGSCFNCSLKLNLFCFLSDEQLKMMDRNRQEVIYKPGETMFKTGGILTHIMCITKGMVKIYIEGENGKRILMGIVKAQQLVGGPGFLVDYRHHFTAVAMEETTVCYVSVEDYKEVMKANPEFSMELVKYLNERIINHYSKIINLTQKHTHGKVADMLIYLSERVYMKDDFETLLSRQDMADMSSMTKESAIRVLKEFEHDGLIVCNTHSFKILNKESLKQISKTG